MPTLRPVAPLTERQLIGWINAQGGEAHVWIRPIPGRDPRLILTISTDAKKREEIITWMANGGGRLDIFLSKFKHLGMKGLTDVLACLNGGYSPHKKTWGTPYIELTTDP
jgi:hypothetical protein